MTHNKIISLKKTEKKMHISVRDLTVLVHFNPETKYEQETYVVSSRGILFAAGPADLLDERHAS